MAITIDAARRQELAYSRHQIDVVWEHVQEQAMRALRAGDSGAARAGWARGLDIAERHFERGDPRLAASETNHAYALRRQQRPYQANNLFQRALSSWEDSWRWVPLMVPPRRPEQAEAGRYDEADQKAFYDVIRQGRQITATLERELRLPVGGLEQWQATKPQTMTDLRKLMAAIFLMVSAKPAAAAARDRPRR